MTRSDRDLMGSVGDGDGDAWSVLVERHRFGLETMAGVLTRSPKVASSVVDAGLELLHRELGAGRGHAFAFRPQALNAAIDVVIDRSRRQQRDDADPGRAAPVRRLFFAVQLADPGQADPLVRAFASQPHRYQVVLWHMAIERAEARDLVEILAIDAVRVERLEGRAREGLRQAIVNEHLDPAADPACAAVVRLLPSFVRGDLGRRQSSVNAHLDECDRCRAVAESVLDLDTALVAAVAPLALGRFTKRYLAAVASSAGIAERTAAGIAVVGTDHFSAAGQLPSEPAVAGAGGARGARGAAGPVGENGQAGPQVDHDVPVDAGALAADDEPLVRSSASVYAHAGRRARHRRSLVGSALAAVIALLVVASMVVFEPDPDVPGRTAVVAVVSEEPATDTGTTVPARGPDATGNEPSATLTSSRPLTSSPSSPAPSSLRTSTTRTVSTSTNTTRSLGSPVEVTGPTTTAPVPTTTRRRSTPATSVEPAPIAEPTVPTPDDPGTVDTTAPTGPGPGGGDVPAPTAPATTAPVPATTAPTTPVPTVPAATTTTAPTTTTIAPTTTTIAPTTTTTLAPTTTTRVPPRTTTTRAR